MTGTRHRRQRRVHAAITSRCLQATPPTSASGPACTSAIPGQQGLHHLVYELVYNSVDEALAGHCNNHPGQDATWTSPASVSPTMAGAFPWSIHPDDRQARLSKSIMTTVGAGAKFDKRTYKTSAGLHGMGAKAVTASLGMVSRPTVQRGNGRVVQAGVRTRQADHRGQGIRAGQQAHGHRKSTSIPTREIFRDAHLRLRHASNRAAAASWPFSTRAWPFKPYRRDAHGKEELFHWPPAAWPSSSST